MSKRRHKSRRDDRVESNNDSKNNLNNANRQSYSNNPFGINPSQLLSMFGNIDMNQINGLLQSMNTQGFDFNNFNLGNLQNLMGNMGGLGNQQAYSSDEFRNDVIKEDNYGLDGSEALVNSSGEDENIQMLKAIRSIVNGERLEFIDKVIELYNKGEFDK